MRRRTRRRPAHRSKPSLPIPSMIDPTQDPNPNHTANNPPHPPPGLLRPAPTSNMPSSDSATASTSGLSYGQLQQLDNLSLSTSTNTAVTAAPSAASASASHHHPRIPLRTNGAPHTPHHHGHSPSEDDARSVGSRLSNAGSTYSAATFYSFGTSNYSGFASSSPARRAMLLTTTEGGAVGGPKRHFVHPQELDPDAVYEVDWVQDDAAKACMACYAEFSALIRRKHHCRACGRVVCSTCLRHKLPVQGLRGLQKACDDCADAAQGRNTGLPLSTSVALIQRGACESISEDDDAEATTTSQPSPAVAAVADAPASCCGGEKEEAAEEELLAGASAAQLHRRQKSLEAKAKAAFPTEENKGGKGKRASKLGYWALAVGAIGGAVAVGSVLVMKRNPELVASVVAQVKRATARR